LFRTAIEQEENRLVKLAKNKRIAIFDGVLMGINHSRLSKNLRRTPILLTALEQFRDGS
jgi:sulfur transfer complex TusBCD TusB component (DsrH family)